MARFRVVLRSTETKPSQSTQESVLPAMSQKFGRDVAIQPAELGPDDQHGVATIGHVDTTDLSVLAAVYDYVKPHKLVKVGTIEASDSGTIRRRKAHKADREALADRDDMVVAEEVRGDLLVRVLGDEDEADEETSLHGGASTGGAAATGDGPGRGYWKSDDEDGDRDDEDQWV
jgi:hypothetical protein